VRSLSNIACEGPRNAL